MRNLKAGMLYFVLVFGAGFILGAIRVPFLVPRLGERWAELIEMPVMLVVIVLAARVAVRRFAVPPSAPARLTIGFLALASLVVAEVLLAVALQDRTLREYVASRDPVSGAAYVVMLCVYALMPQLLATFVATRARAADTSRANPSR